MVKLRKTIIFIMSVYLFILVVRFHAILNGITVPDELKTALVDNDLQKQINSLNLFINFSNYQFKKYLNEIFKNKEDYLLDKLVLTDNPELIKKYFNVKKIFDIKEGKKKRLLEKALASSSLRIATHLINEGKVKLTSKMLVENFDSIARNNNYEDIKAFIKGIKKIQKMRALLEERNRYDEDMTLKGLIHYVAQRCNMKWLKALIQEGAVVTLEDKWKNNPFHLAVLTLKPDTLDKKIEFINYMIKKKKIAVLYTNRDNKTALDLAEEYLKRYKKLYDSAKSLIFKSYIKKNVVVYNKLVGILKKLQRD